MGVYIERKRGEEEIVQAVPREAVIALELIGTRLTVRTRESVLEVQLQPEKVDGVKALLYYFLDGKTIRIKEE